MLRSLLLCLLACALSSCAFFYSHQLHKRYSRVRITNIEGRLIAEWIAEGFCARTETGYKFKAVQRNTGAPFPQEIHYPYGRQIEVGGQNIIVSRTSEPRWYASCEATKAPPGVTSVNLRATHEIALRETRNGPETHDDGL